MSTEVKARFNAKQTECTVCFCSTNPTQISEHSVCRTTCELRLLVCIQIQQFCCISWWWCRQAVCCARLGAVFNLTQISSGVSTVIACLLRVLFLSQGNLYIETFSHICKLFSSTFTTKFSVRIGLSTRTIQKHAMLQWDHNYDLYCHCNFAL